MPAPIIPLHIRLIDNSIPVTECGCWIWTGVILRSGYGEIQIGGRKYRAHRIAFDTFVRKLGDDEIVRHTCDTPPCINPTHLRAGTQGDNMRDMFAKGRRSNDFLYRPVESVNPVTGETKRYEKIIDVIADGFTPQAVIRAAKTPGAKSGNLYWRYTIA